MTVDEHLLLEDFFLLKIRFVFKLVFFFFIYRQMKILFFCGGRFHTLGITDNCYSKIIYFDYFIETCKSV